MPSFYAHVEHREYGEQPRTIRLGPFTLDGCRYEAEDELRRNLEEQGELVNYIERIEHA